MQSASAISFVVMAAAKHPEEAAKVQVELDNVVGRDRCKNTTSLIHRFATQSAFTIIQYRHSKMASCCLACLHSSGRRSVGGKSHSAAIMATFVVFDSDTTILSLLVGAVLHIVQRKTLNTSAEGFLSNLSYH